MGEIFTVKNIIIYVLAINLITFLAMYLDKRKAKKGNWRTKESTLFGLVMLGGGIGGIIGMYTFRHKTQKLAFVIGFPAILVLEIVGVLVTVFL
jgi:uncharacterized membrane protein YsdA (DUF1294 family)